MYIVGFGLDTTAFAASTPAWPPRRHQAVGRSRATATVGLGGHFANVIPDLAGDEAAGVRGLPQRLAARRGPLAVRLAALTLLLLASVFLVLASSPSHRWIAIAGLAVAAVLATIGARAPGRLPFLAAIGIAAVDVALFAFGGVVLV